MHAVQELQENGREAAALTVGTQVAPLAEFVAEGEPFFFQENLEAFQSPVERIAQQLHQRHHLQREKTQLLQIELRLSSLNLFYVLFLHDTTIPL